MVDGAQSSISHIPYTPAAAARDEDLREGEFYAVRDVSFQLRRGECLGLIGHNGAGKTTLLKMLNGLIKPDRGRIEMNGRVGALIALGAGFNPILTGRENIYINGSVLGLSKKEINDKIDEIIDFAEIGEFIDMPVQNYSSGMQVRLGFSVASSLSPDVLILDEVLAVGDIKFVVKCLNRMREVSKNSAVVFVSHNMQYISSFCSRAILMEKGTLALDAKDKSLALERYFNLVESTSCVSGAGFVSFESCSIGVLHHNNIEPTIKFTQGSQVSGEVKVNVSSLSEPARLSVAVEDLAQNTIITFPLINETKQDLIFTPGAYQVRFNLGPIELNSGKYSIMLAADGINSGIVLGRSAGNSPFQVEAGRHLWSKIVRPVAPIVTSLYSS